MEIYNHFAYGRKLAEKLKPIAPHHFYTAYGLEDLPDFEDRLSSVAGYVLIAVNGYESDSSDNRADGLTDTMQYAFIVAHNTVSDRQETIEAAFESSRAICKQIRNALLLDDELRGYIHKETQINGIGPIGDNFYGCMLSFSVTIPESYHLSADYWEE